MFMHFQQGPLGAWVKIHGYIIMYVDLLMDLMMFVVPSYDIFAQLPEVAYGDTRDSNFGDPTYL